MEGRVLVCTAEGKMEGCVLVCTAEGNYEEDTCHFFSLLYNISVALAVPFLL